jgi:hypothetical protein
MQIYVTGQCWEERHQTRKDEVLKYLKNINENVLA